MPLNGTLCTWNDDRGFGFIAPTHGGREIFVHVSAFPRDGTRPTVGEKLTYELGRGKDGQPQAVRVVRDALGHPSTHPARRRPRSGAKRPAVPMLLVAVLLAGAGGAAYVTLRPEPDRMATPDALLAPATEPAATTAAYRCDGRTHCSQMTSCSEAKYFLQNCPGVKMDGNHDGVPCEQQWCTSPLAR